MDDATLKMFARVLVETIRERGRVNDEDEQAIYGALLRAVASERQACARACQAVIDRLSAELAQANRNLAAFQANDDRLAALLEEHPESKQPAPLVTRIETHVRRLRFDLAQVRAQAHDYHATLVLEREAFRRHEDERVAQIEQARAENQMLKLEVTGRDRVHWKTRAEKAEAEVQAWREIDGGPKCALARYRARELLGYDVALSAPPPAQPNESPGGETLTLLARCESALQLAGNGPPHDESWTQLRNDLRKALGWGLCQPSGDSPTSEGASEHEQASKAEASTTAQASVVDSMDHVAAVGIQEVTPPQPESPAFGHGTANRYSAADCGMAPAPESPAAEVELARSWNEGFSAGVKAMKGDGIREFPPENPYRLEHKR